MLPNNLKIASAASLWLMVSLCAATMKTPETSRHFQKWTDPESGVVSYVLKTRVAQQQQSFYFVNRSMTNDGRFLLFSCINPPSNTRTMGVVDFKKDEVYTYPRINSFVASPYLDIDTADLYWTTNRGLFQHSLLSHCKCTIEKISGIPECFPEAQYRFYHLACHLVPNASKTKFFLDARVDNEFIYGDIDIATGNYTEWGRTDFMFNHAQFNPTDDDMVFVCKEFWNDVITGELYTIPTDPNGVFERLWLWKRGEEPRLIAPIDGGKATHEWWSSDGKSLYYCTYPNYGIARYNLDTEQSTMITTIRATHAHGTSNDKYFVFDQHIGDFYRGCAWKVFFYNSVTDKSATIVSHSPKYNEPEDPSTWHPDPHPNFVCNDTYIVSTLNIDGAMNLLVTPVAPLIQMTE
jgi:hypothetical protein